MLFLLGLPRVAQIYAVMILSPTSEGSFRAFGVQMHTVFSSEFTSCRILGILEVKLKSGYSAWEIHEYLFVCIYARICYKEETEDVFS